MSGKPSYLNVSDLADLLRCSRRQAYRVIALDGFPRAVVVYGSSKRWILEEVDAWIRQRAPRAA